MPLTLTSTFFIEAKTVEEQFREIISMKNYDPELKRAAESVLIMYDQMIAEFELEESQVDDYCDFLFG